MLLARYVPYVAKRSIYYEISVRRSIILRTTDNRRPLIWPILGKFQIAISPRGVVRSTSCLVLRWGFGGQRIEWRYFRFHQIQDGGSAAILPPSRKIQMAISPRRIVRFTSCLVLGRGFRGWRIEWRYFRFRQIQDGGAAAILKNSNGDISAADRPIYFVFGSKTRYSGSADRMALFPVSPIPRWRRSLLNLHELQYISPPLPHHSSASSMLMA